MPKPSQQAVKGEQFYVTHCATADSVLNNPGYTVRAASRADDRDALEAAFRYPPYDLPIDMWRDLPARAELAPRRLARTLDDSNRLWVVHSAYLPKDSVGRDRSYFSHLFVLEAGPQAVLESWGAPAWATEYPPGAPKQLSAGGLPEGDLVGEDALTKFLGKERFDQQELGRCVCPSRLSADQRREVLARALHAMLLRAAADEPRRRLYIHAEPGLVALALYAAVRLLPATVTQGLTFSTFEPYHRNFREYKLADVVGTYLGAKDKALDADLGTARGFVLDTFDLARSSPELQQALPSGIGELLDLVAKGDWHLLERVRSDIGADATGLALAADAVQRARLVAKLDAGAADIDDLLALKKQPLAAHDLGRNIDAVWAQVRGNLDKANVRAAFRDLIAAPARVKELWLAAVDALLTENFRKWDLLWPVVREFGGRDEAARRLNKLVGDDNEDRLRKQPIDMRAKMRAACTDVQLFPSRGLLVPTGIGELETLLGGPHDQAGYTAFVILAPDSFEWLKHVQPNYREQMRARAKQYLYDVPLPAFAAYVRAARAYLTTDSHFLDVLFKPHSEPAAALLSRVLAANVLEPSDWRKLYDSLPLGGEEWSALMLNGNHLSRLLFGLGGEGIGREVWQVYLEALSPALVSSELIVTEDGSDPMTVTMWERNVHAQLKRAAEQLTAAEQKLATALPEGGVGKLFAANSLVKWATEPASVANEKDATNEFHNACRVFDIKPFDFLHAVFKDGKYEELDLPVELLKLEPLITLFRTAFPADLAHNARSSVTEWLKLSQEFPKGGRAHFQYEFVLKCVPESYYRDLLNETRRVPFEPVAVARINQVIEGKVKKPKAQKAARPTLPESNLVDEVNEDDQGSGELPTGEDVAKTKPKSKSKSGKKKGDYKKSRRNARRGGGGGWMLWVAGGLLFLVLVGGAIFALSGKSDSPKKDESPPKAKPEPPPPPPPKAKTDTPPKPGDKKQ
jgi:GTPase-associated protein 1, N-terminal domain type 2